MGVSIEMENRLEPLVIPHFTTTRLAQAMNIAMANGQRFFLVEPPDEDEEPMVFAMGHVLVVEPHEDALGTSF